MGTIVKQIKNKGAENLLFEVKKKVFRDLPKKNQRFGDQNLTDFGRQIGLDYYTFRYETQKRLDSQYDQP
ncbi:MAG: hypothetical protein A2007_05670 [Verrucomicrobia bacterium GWC2_42_7]|nr:MAG: hypothetical protein A2007_05670 [Verrucomicrobia bacterium GWC2_42_7]